MGRAESELLPTWFWQSGVGFARYIPAAEQIDSAWFAHLEDCVRSSPAWHGENPLDDEVR